MRVSMNDKKKRAAKTVGSSKETEINEMSCYSTNYKRAR